MKYDNTDSTMDPRELITDPIQSTTHDGYSLPSSLVAHSSIYTKLDKSKGEIRICDLRLSGEFDDPIKCTLRVVPVTRMASCVAFSYVWGDPPDTEPISINETQHHIRPNLAAGIRQFRARSWQDQTMKRRRRSISVWIDAICINQQDTAERNHQVPHMREIFSRSMYTFSWLGEADETSDLAMDSIEGFAHFAKDDSRMTLFSEFNADITLLSKLTQPGSVFCHFEPWDAIYRLLDREFWHRVWIYQELVLPKKLLIACGSRSLTLETFQKLACILLMGESEIDELRLLGQSLPHLSPDVIHQIHAVRRILDRLIYVVWGSNTESIIQITSILFSVALRTCHLKATDPRDKIYGVLSLSQGPLILPDYTKSIQTVYTEFAKLGLSQKLELLEWSGTFNKGEDRNWPSWVPHWDRIRQLMPSMAKTWKSSSDLLYSWNWKIQSSGEFIFDTFPHLTALRLSGQLGPHIVEIKSHDEFLEVESYNSMIIKMSKELYPRWIEGGQGKLPIWKLIALQRTLVQQSDSETAEEKMGEAAGFCSAVISRLNGRSEASKTSLSALLKMFEFEFRSRPECFDNPHQYRDDYLFREKNSLRRRLFFETSAGHFGLGPLDIQRGDIIAKIDGLGFPLVLRQVDAHYVIIGTCWVLGFMGIQGMDASKCEMLEIW